MIPGYLLNTFFPVSEIILGIWLIAGLIVSGLVGALTGRKAFLWTLGITCVLMPTVAALYISASNRKIETENRKILERLGTEYRQLCDAADRIVIRRTVRDVREIQVEPGVGPKDSWGNDLFYPYRSRAATPASVRWLLGAEGGRYGGYRRVVSSEEVSAATGMPRYRVVLKHLAAGDVEGRKTIHGVEIQIIDRESQAVIAERRDYAGTLNGDFAFPSGCAGRKHEDRRRWHRDMLSFIHEVLVPPPGVRIVEKNITEMPDRRPWGHAKPEDFPEEITAQVRREGPATTKFDSIEKHMPPGTKYGYIRRGEEQDWHFDRAITLLKSDMDIRMGQALNGYNTSLLAATFDGEGLVTVFAAGMQSKSDRPFLIVRRFDLDGNLRAQARLTLLDLESKVAYVASPDHELRMSGQRYLMWISLRDGKGGGRDIEISFPRKIPAVPSPPDSSAS